MFRSATPLLKSCSKKAVVRRKYAVKRQYAQVRDAPLQVLHAHDAVASASAFVLLYQYSK